MHKSTRFSAALSSHAERGVESIAGCAPFGLQRAVQRRAQMSQASAVAFEVRALPAKFFKAKLACSSRSARQVASALLHHVSPTLPSSGRPTASRGPPLKSNVGRRCKLALMHEPSRFAVVASSHVSRGGKSVPGCSRCRSQQSICAPRSMPARIRLWGSAPAFVFHHRPGKLGLSGTAGAASSFCLASPRKPNPAFERTA